MIPNQTKLQTSKSLLMMNHQDRSIELTNHKITDHIIEIDEKAKINKSIIRKRPSIMEGGTDGSIKILSFA